MHSGAKLLFPFISHTIYTGKIKSTKGQVVDRSYVVRIGQIFRTDDLDVPRVPKGNSPWMDCCHSRGGIDREVLAGDWVIQGMSRLGFYENVIRTSIPFLLCLNEECCLISWEEIEVPSKPNVDLVAINGFRCLFEGTTVSQD